MTLDHNEDVNNGRQGAAVNTGMHLLVTTLNFFHPSHSLNLQNKYHVAQILLLDITSQLDLQISLLSQRLRHPVSPSLQSPQRPLRSDSHFQKLNGRCAFKYHHHYASANHGVPLSRCRKRHQYHHLQRHIQHFLRGNLHQGVYVQRDCFRALGCISLPQRHRRRSMGLPQQCE